MPVVLGAALGILLHELGHNVIKEFELPAVGPEEDDADEFASIVFVYNVRRDPRFADLALWVPRFWREVALAGEKRGFTGIYFTDEHSPTMLRYGRILCILVGGEPKAFEEELKRTVPENDRPRFVGRCQEVFRKKERAWDTLLKPHRRNIDPNLPGDLPADAPGHKMTVDYSWLDVAIASDFTRKFGPILKQSGVFDTVAETLTKYYVLPRDVTIFVRECDINNAWYTPPTGSISFCMNFIDEFLKSFPELKLPQGLQGTPDRPRPRPKQ